MSLAKRNAPDSAALLRLFGTGFLIGTLLIIIAGLTIYLMQELQWTGIHFVAGEFFASLAFLMVIAAAEEYIFRAWLLRWLLRRMNLWLALCISAIVFTAVHLANMHITLLALVNIFFGGLCFGAMYLSSRSLAMTIGFHAAWNFIQGPVLGFTVSGLPFESLLTMQLSQNNIINGGEFGLEGSIVCTVVLSAFFLLHLKPLSKLAHHYN